MRLRIDELCYVLLEGEAITANRMMSYNFDHIFELLACQLVIERADCTEPSARVCISPNLLCLRSFLRKTMVFSLKQCGCEGRRDH